MGWNEHDEDVFHGCEKFFRPGYAANLVSAWIPALEGVKEKLERGGTVADVGCGLGASTILMAKSYPKSKFFGFDYHDKSIETARQRAKDAGMGDRIEFSRRKGEGLSGKGLRLHHILRLPARYGRSGRSGLPCAQQFESDGTWMIVEPFAHDGLKDNLNPVGRVYYSFSTLLCTPCSRSQEVALCLGAQSGEKRIREVVTLAAASAVSVEPRKLRLTSSTKLVHDRNFIARGTAARS